MSQRGPFRYIKTPPEVIDLAVMLYLRFPLSLRNVEDLLHKLSTEASHKYVRFWYSAWVDRQTAEIHTRIALTNRFPALGQAEIARVA